MTHTRQYAEHEGTFGEAEKANPITCRKCGKNNVVVREWESSDGAYSDTKYTCHDCNHRWWVDGPDA